LTRSTHDGELSGGAPRRLSRPTHSELTCLRGGAIARRPAPRAVTGV